MKPYFFLFPLLVFFTPCSAQQWDWARQAQSCNDEQNGVSVVVDRTNSFVYQLGYNENNASYGTFALDSGYFVAKYTLQGGLVWAKKLPAHARSIANDQNGNLFVAGEFSASISTGGFVVTSIGGSDLYLLKMDGNGTATSLRRFGGPWDDVVNVIKINTNNELFMTGSYDRAISFDNASCASALQKRLFYLSKLNSAGQVEWLRTCPENAPDSMRYESSELLALDKQGSAYIFGRVNYPAPPCQMYCYGFFLNKYSGNGTLMMEKPVFDVYDFATALEIDDSLNIIMVQHCGSHYTSCKSLVKYNQQLTKKWETFLGSYGYGPTGFLAGLSVDKACNIYLAGMAAEFGDNADTLAVYNSTIYTGGAADVMIGQFDAGGQNQWVVNAKGMGQEWINYGAVMDIDNVGNCYVTGCCRSPQNYSPTLPGQVAFGTDTIVGYGPWNTSFVAKLMNPNPVTVSAGHEINALSSIVAYPNPSTGQFHLKGIRADQNCIVNCTDVYGRSLLTTNVQENKVDLSGLHPGIYFLQINSNNVRKTIKIEVSGE